MNRYVMLLMIVTLSVAVLVIVNHFRQIANHEFSSSSDSVESYYSNLAFQGLVSNKFEDPNNHYSRTLVINSESNTMDSIVDDFDGSGFYDYVLEGDSVVKKKGEMKILLHRGKSDTLFDISLK